MIKRILTSLLSCAMTAISCVAHPMNTNHLDVVYTNTPSEWNDFNWMWSGASDQSLEIDFYGQQPSNLFLRLSKPDGSQYLTTQAGSLSDFGTNYRRWSVSIAKSNLPPSNVYRTEILSSSDSTTNIEDAVTLVMAKGRTRVQWSAFDGYPSTNNLWIYGDGWFTEHDLKALSQVVILSNWVEAIRSGMINSNTYLIGYIDSLFLSATQRIHALETGRYTKAESDARFLTNGSIVAESDPVWLSEKSGYVTTQNLHILSLKHADATNKLQTVFSWGDHTTNGYIRAALTNEYLFNGVQVAQFISTNRPGAGIPYVRVSKPSIYYPVVEIYESANNTTSRFGIFNGRLAEVESDGGGGVPYWNDNTNGLGSVNASLTIASTNASFATNELRLLKSSLNTNATALNARIEQIEYYYIPGSVVSNSFVKTTLGSYTGNLSIAGIVSVVGSYLAVGNNPALTGDSVFLDSQTPSGPGYFTVESNKYAQLRPVSTDTGDWVRWQRPHGTGYPNATNFAIFWDSVSLPDPRNAFAMTNIPAAWTTEWNKVTNWYTNITVIADKPGTDFKTIGAMSTNGYAAGAMVTHGMAGLYMYNGRSTYMPFFYIDNTGTNVMFSDGGGTQRTPWHDGNFSPNSYWLMSESVAWRTNAIKFYRGSVTQNQIVAINEVWQNGTNVWFGLGDTNSLRVNGQINVY